MARQRLLVRIPLVALLLLLPLLAGCPKVETTARDTIAAAKGTLDSLKAQYPQCSAAGVVITAGSTCDLLKKATSAKDLAIDALEAYCGGPAFDAGGVCTPPAKGSSAATQLAAKLKTAISGLNQTVADLKGVK